MATRSIARPADMTPEYKFFCDLADEVFIRPSPPKMGPGVFGLSTHYWWGEATENQMDALMTASMNAIMAEVAKGRCDGGFVFLSTPEFFAFKETVMRTLCACNSFDSENYKISISEMNNWEKAMQKCIEAEIRLRRK